MAFLLPPLRGRDLGRSTLDLARQGQRRAPHVGIAPARLDSHVHVDAARAGGLRPAGVPELLEHLADDERDAPHVVPADARPGIEVDPQLIGMVEVAGSDRVRVEVDAAEVDDPRQRGRVVDDDLVGRASGREGELDRPHESGTDFGARFWKKACPVAPSTNRFSAIGRSGRRAAHRRPPPGSSGRGRSS